MIIRTREVMGEFLQYFAEVPNQNFLQIFNDDEFSYIEVAENIPDQIIADLQNLYPQLDVMVVSNFPESYQAIHNTNNN